jgi:perosamine synthetase
VSSDLITICLHPRWRNFWATAAPFRDTLRSYAGLFASGRAALHWACRGLNLPARTVAWMPSFHCGVEVHAALTAGFDIRFYRILPDLSVDEDDLRRKLDLAAGVVLVIHYFGFPQPGIERLADLCRVAGSVLIEDCAHSLFSAKGEVPLGSFAPLAVFSLQKTLPMFDGGALQVNRRHLTSPFKSPPPNVFSLSPYLDCVKSLARQLGSGAITEMYRRWSGPRNLPTAANFDVPCRKDSPQGYTHRLSALSRHFAEANDPFLEVSRRRKNWTILREFISGLPRFESVFDQLPASVCPLVFPIRHSQRDALKRYLAAHRIESYRFGAYAHPAYDVAAFPDTCALRETILGLPVHSGLTENHLRRVAQVLESFAA